MADFQSKRKNQDSDIDDSEYTDDLLSSKKSIKTQDLMSQ